VRPNRIGILRATLSAGLEAFVGLRGHDIISKCCFGRLTSVNQLLTMTTTLTVRSFTGKAISLQVDPASKISYVKDTIIEVMGRKSRPVLTCKGHELRDHQSLSHYGITARDVLHICECQYFIVIFFTLTGVMVIHKHRPQRLQRLRCSSKSRTASVSPSR
jgi:hypothetical protein